ncbi:hypothetical protein [Desulfospira joergensenii]|uniref:hypothetical protein n=1 Tax=Desulfospira joergensenii TaxID=53329 RepID=UPI0003B7A57F|nr:hypothetical protein [Desulfospira joergensenii]
MSVNQAPRKMVQITKADSLKIIAEYQNKFGKATAAGTVSQILKEYSEMEKELSRLKDFIREIQRKAVSLL